MPETEISQTDQVPLDVSEPTTAPANRWAPLFIATVYLAYWHIAPRLPAISFGSIVLSSVVSLSLAIWLPAAFGRVPRSLKSTLINVGIALMVIVPLRVMSVVGQPFPPWSFILGIPGMADLAVIWLASSLGVLLSRIVRTANLIPPIVAVLALVDIWTVLLGGPVQQIMKSETAGARAVTQAMTVPLPVPKVVTGAAPFPLTQIRIGFADFLFVAFFIAAICRFSTNPKAYSRTLQGFILILGLYLLLVIYRDVSLPALVPMAIVMLGLHWREFHYEREELFALLWAGLFIAVIAGGFWWMSKGRKQSPAPEEAPPRAQAMMPEHLWLRLQLPAEPCGGYTLRSSTHCV